jgi:hypothetical protein
VRVEFRPGRAASGKYLPDEHEPTRLQEQVVDLRVEDGCAVHQ